MLWMTMEGSLVGVGRQVRGCCSRGELQGSGEAPRTQDPAKPREAAVWLLAGLRCSVPLEVPGLIAGPPSNLKWAWKAFENGQGPWN